MKNGLTDTFRRGDDNKPLNGYIFSAYHTDTQHLSLVGMRGLPNDASAEVLQEEDIYGISWAMWTELKSIEWLEGESSHYGGKYRYIHPDGDTYETVLTFSWQLIFDMMNTLSKYHGEDNVRLVVWFI